MILLDSLAEERISNAIRRGEFENLEGAGQPLSLEDDNIVAEPLRVAFRLLKNAGCLPPELTLRQDISRLENLLTLVEAESERQSIRQKIDLLKARLPQQGREISLLLQDGAYREKIIRKLGGKTVAGIK